MGFFNKKRDHSAHASARQYPSSSSDQPVFPKPIERRGKTMRNGAISPSSTPETTIHVPEIELNLDNGEPLVQDFQDLYLPKSAYAGKPDRGVKAGADAPSAKAGKYPVKLNDESASPPPDINRRVNTLPKEISAPSKHAVQRSQGSKQYAQAASPPPILSPPANFAPRTYSLTSQQHDQCYQQIWRTTNQNFQKRSLIARIRRESPIFDVSTHVNLMALFFNAATLTQAISPSSRPIFHVRHDSGSYAQSSQQSPERSSVESGRSSAETPETKATSISDLPPLQTRGPPDEFDMLEPVMEDDPKSYDLVAPPEERPGEIYSLENRSELLFSREHLQAIFNDPKQFMGFTSFMSQHRPQSIPVLVYFLDALKALRAIKYANAVAEALQPIPGLEFTKNGVYPSENSALAAKANQAFDFLVQEELPAYITHTWVQVVSVSIYRRITGTLPPHLRESSEGLAEVFCLTDPSRHDNPIVFASQEFYRTTQYGMNYVIGRNCRFLQGPKTKKHSINRFREAVAEPREQCEVFLNYRRDGSPFMNLLMIAPLFDSRGNTRYFIGAQVDVSGLAKECTDLEALQAMSEEARNTESEELEASEKKDKFQELSEMLNITELDTVRKYGGRMHREHVEESEGAHSTAYHRPRLLLKDNSVLEKKGHSFNRANGKLSGIFQHYLLVRPYPALRILFTSPSLRVPGILQSPFMSKIGGSPRVRDELTAALARGDNVTAKIRWVFKSEDEGRSRWIHCTPLVGHNGAVGVWMIIMVDDDARGTTRRFRQAPPVSDRIGNTGFDKGKERASSKRRDNGDSDDGGEYDYYDLQERQPWKDSARSQRAAGDRGRKSNEYSRPGTSMSGVRAGRDPSAAVRSEFTFNIQ